MMTKEELAILKKCYEQARAIEKKGLRAESSELGQELFLLSGLLRTFEQSENLSLRKLSEIPEHFFPGMSLKHFTNFIIPIERALGRELSDDQFVILDQDRSITPSASAPLMLVLDNIRSAFNVGSIFRLGDCLKVEKIHLCGYTPTPEQEILQKTALGAQAHVAFESHADIKTAIAKIKTLGTYQLIALETAKNAVPLYELNLTKPCAFIVGNERFGLESDVLDKCDAVASIPTYGIKNSLNVAMALSIAAYEWNRQYYHDKKR